MTMITELVDRLKNFANEYAFADTDTMDVLNDAADVIDELSAKLQAANMERSSQYYNCGWIKCEDRLPEESERVLMFYERNAWGENGLFRKKTIDIGWHVEGRWHVDGCSGVVGIAWMPLPKLYNAEREDKKCSE